MTPQEILDELEAFIKEELKELKLPVNRKAWPEGPERQGFYITQMAMDDPSDYEGRVPYVLLQFLNGADEEDKSTVDVRIVIVLYDQNRRTGRASVMHVIQKLRNALLQKGVLADRAVLQKPLEYLVYPDDSGSYHLGEMMTIWSIPPVERDIFGLHAPYFM